MAISVQCARLKPNWLSAVDRYLASRNSKTCSSTLERALSWNAWQLHGLIVGVTYWLASTRTNWQRHELIGNVTNWLTTIQGPQRDTLWTQPREHHWITIPVLQAMLIRLSVETSKLLVKLIHRYCQRKYGSLFILGSLFITLTKDQLWNSLMNFSVNIYLSVNFY